MKKSFIYFCLTIISIGLFSCTNKEEFAREGREITITAYTDFDNFSTKTSIAPGEVPGTYKPSWSATDVIRLFTTSNNYKVFTPTLSSGVATKFTGTITAPAAGDHTLYAFYPGNVDGNTDYTKVKIELPAEQNPTSGSFDGAADILIATPNPVTIAESTTSLETNFSFTRMNSVILINIPSSTITKSGISSSEKIEKVVFKAGSSISDYVLSGRAYYNLSTVTLTSGDGLGFYYNKANYVTANYSGDSKPALGGATIWLLCNPFELTADKSLTIEITTEDHIITRTVSGVTKSFEQGKVTPINLAIGDNCTATQIVGASLPWTIDFSSVTGTSEWTNLATETNPLWAGKITSSTKVYKCNGTVKYGASSAAGSLTTQKLDLSAEGGFTVIVYASGVTASENTFYVTVGGTEKSFSCLAYGTASIPGDIVPYCLHFDKASVKEAITVATKTDAKRSYIQKIEVKTGTISDGPYVYPISITVPTAGATNKTITINNYRTGDYTPTVTYDGTIITSASYDKSTKVMTYSCSANSSTAREGWIRVTFNDAASTVNTITAIQSAGNIKSLVASTITSPTENIPYTGSGTIVAADGTEWAYKGLFHNYNTVTIQHNNGHTDGANGYIQTPTSTKKIKTLTINTASNSTSRYYILQSTSDTETNVTTNIMKMATNGGDMVFDFSDKNYTAVKIFSSGGAMALYSISIEYVTE